MNIKDLFYIYEENWNFISLWNILLFKKEKKNLNELNRLNLIC